MCGDGVTVCEIANPDCPGGGLCYSNNGLMGGWSATINSSGYAGVLGPSFPECDGNEDCQIYDPYPVATCNTTEGVCNPNACAFIDWTRNDYTFNGLSEVPAVSTATLDYGFLSALFGASVAYADVGYCEDDPTLDCNMDDKCCEDDPTIECDVDQDCIDGGAAGPCVADPTCCCLAGGALGPCAREMYCATLVLDVPAVGAAGTYTIGFIDHPGLTNVKDSATWMIVPFNLNPAVITVRCATTADCDDCDECTNDGCNSGECEYIYNFDTGPDELPYTPDDVECCDPATGTILPIDDGNDCTADECDPETGQVTHPNLPEGTDCGAGPTECSDQDTCDGAGTCDPNHFTSGTTCGDPPGVCSDQDTCDGAGTCLPNDHAPDTPCGSPLDDDCTDPDTCDRSGTCLPNHADNGDPCDDGLYCTTDEYCTDGECGNGDPACDDEKSCTDDSCNEDLDECTNAPNNAHCDDDLYCNGDEVCNPEDLETTPDGCAHANPPCGGPCNEEEDKCLCGTPLVIAPEEGTSSRYLKVVPQADAETKMWLVVTGDCPGGLTKYIGWPLPFDVNKDGTPDGTVAFLVDDQAHAPKLTPAEWSDTVYITGADLAPGMNYIVRADCGTEGSPGLSNPGGGVTWIRGDVNGDEIVGIDDLMFCIAAFQGDYSNVTLDRVDQMGGDDCLPEGVIGITDLLEVVAAFQRQPPYGCPDLCP